MTREDRGYWCMPEADLGLPLTPEYASLLRLGCPAGRRTRHWYPGGGTAAQTLAAGIVHQVAADDEVAPQTTKVAVDLAAKDRRILSERKRLLYGEAIRKLLG